MPPRSKQTGAMSPKPASSPAAWRAKLRKGMLQNCASEDAAMEALDAVLDAPADVVEDARSAYCAPNKRAAWDKFLARVLGAAAAKRLLLPTGAAAAAVAPVAASPPQSPPASPRRRGRPSNASKAAAVTTPATTPPYAPTALDYAALASAGVGVGVVAAAAAPGGGDALARGFQRAIQSLAAATGADDAAVRWVLKVVTVGGTLALSGAVVGGIILALASVIVYAVFAGAGRGGGARR